MRDFSQLGRWLRTALCDWKTLLLRHSRPREEVADASLRNPESEKCGRETGRCSAHEPREGRGSRAVVAQLVDGHEEGHKRRAASEDRAPRATEATRASSVGTHEFKAKGAEAKSAPEQKRTEKRRHQAKSLGRGERNGSDE